MSANSVLCSTHSNFSKIAILYCAAEGQRVPLCHVVVGGSTGSLRYLHNAVAEKFPVLLLKVRHASPSLFSV